MKRKKGIYNKGKSIFEVEESISLAEKLINEIRMLILILVLSIIVATACILW